MKARILLGATLAAALSAAVAAGMIGSIGVANADPQAAPICGADEATVGTSLSGNYTDLTVKGVAYVANGASLTVSGNLTLAAGSCLDAFSTGTVVVGRNVAVGNGATLALGCAPGSNGPPPIAPCFFTTTNDVVGGNITADQPRTMYLTAVTVGGNVVSNGGGFSAPGLNFPVKDMKIAGNLILQGWTGGPGAWIGALRNQVDGNVVFDNNVGHRPGGGFPNDSSEIVGNTVGGNLICQNNTPAALYGDAYGEAPGNGPNTVGRHAIGECADLTVPPTG